MLFSLKVEGELGKENRAFPMGSPLQVCSQADLVRREYKWKSGI